VAFGVLQATTSMYSDIFVQHKIYAVYVLLCLSSFWNIYRGEQRRETEWSLSCLCLNLFRSLSLLFRNIFIATHFVKSCLPSVPEGRKYKIVFRWNGYIWKLHWEVVFAKYLDKSSKDISLVFRYSFNNYAVVEPINFRSR
jgi:hypothetical protein